MCQIILLQCPTVYISTQLEEHKKLCILKEKVLVTSGLIRSPPPRIPTG